MRVRDLTWANRVLKELRDLQQVIMYRSMTMPVNNASVWTFSDASFNIVSGREYGQTGIITGIMMTGGDRRKSFHLVNWASITQRRASHSSYGAELLACSDADDRGIYLKQAINAIYQGSGVRHIMHVDYRGLFDTISTLHDGKEYRLKQIVQRIRDSFEEGDIDILRWIPSGQNMADCLTKRCAQIQRTFNGCCTSGRLTINTSNMKELDSLTWK